MLVVKRPGRSYYFCQVVEESIYFGRFISGVKHGHCFITVMMISQLPGNCYFNLVVLRPTSKNKVKSQMLFFKTFNHSKITNFMTLYAKI
jgi:hypothetical protein